jgi:hypothetical protein
MQVNYSRTVKTIILPDMRVKTDLSVYRYKISGHGNPLYEKLSSRNGGSPAGRNVVWPRRKPMQPII